MKYYSAFEASKKHLKLNRREFELRRKLENCFKLKKDIQLTVRELRVAIKEYYKLLAQNLQDYKKISLMLREKLANSRAHNDIIIEEASEDAECSARDMISSREKFRRMERSVDLTERIKLKSQ